MFLQHKRFGFLKNKETTITLWKMSSIASRNVIWSDPQESSPVLVEGKGKSDLADVPMQNQDGNL